MIGVIATMAIKPGMEAEFEKHALALVAKVKANEPDCLMYDLFKAKEGSVYTFMETYKNKEAVKAHGQTEYFLAAQSVLGACLAGAPDMQVLNAV